MLVAKMGAISLLLHENEDNEIKKGQFAFQTPPRTHWGLQKGDLHWGWETETPGVHLLGFSSWWGNGLKGEKWWETARKRTAADFALRNFPLFQVFQFLVQLDKYRMAGSFRLEKPPKILKSCCHPSAAKPNDTNSPLVSERQWTHCAPGDSDVTQR